MTKLAHQVLVAAVLASIAVACTSSSEEGVVTSGQRLTEVDVVVEDPESIPVCEATPPEDDDAPMVDVTLGVETMSVGDTCNWTGEKQTSNTCRMAYNYYKDKNGKMCRGTAFCDGRKTYETCGSNKKVTKMRYEACPKGIPNSPADCK